jgi:hypothetical protein
MFSTDFPGGPPELALLAAARGARATTANLLSRFGK